MEPLLRILGDGLTIAALSIMCATSLMAARRIPANVRVPMQWGVSGKATWRAPRNVAIWTIPAVAAVVLFAFTASGLTHTAVGATAMVVFGVRALMASLLALLHLLHLRWALKTLIEDGDIPS